SHYPRSSVSTTDHPSFTNAFIPISTRRRSPRRWLTPTKVSCGVRRSPSRRSRTTTTSRQSSKWRRNSSYRSRRLRATTMKGSTPTPSTQIVRGHRLDIEAPHQQAPQDLVRGSPRGPVEKPDSLTSPPLAPSIAASYHRD